MTLNAGDWVEYIGDLDGPDIAEYVQGGREYGDEVTFTKGCDVKCGAIGKVTHKEVQMPWRYRVLILYNNNTVYTQQETFYVGGNDHNFSKLSPDRRKDWEQHIETVRTLKEVHKDDEGIISNITFDWVGEESGYTTVLYKLDNTSMRAEIVNPPDRDKTIYLYRKTSGALEWERIYPTEETT